MAPKHYIFGYGSLISASSRRITGIAGDSVAARVSGFERSWVSWKGTQMRAVAVSAKPNSQCNGVLFEVPETELPKFDAREMNYVRMSLDHSQLSYLHPAQAIKPDSLVWVYVYDNNEQGLDSTPIVQSYLDVILLGCLDIAPGFAEEFLQNTNNWHGLVDDRHRPVYARPQQHKQSVQLDQLLQEYCPNAFSQRRLSA